MSGKKRNPQPRRASGDYEVGYGKAPKEHRFKPGQSGNPNGSSRKAKARSFDESRFADLLAKEAARLVTVNGEQLTAEQALMRSTFLNGIKGKVTAQRMALQLLERKESERKQVKQDLVADAIEYKRVWTPELKRLREKGLPEPDLPVDPDDLHIDLLTGEVSVISFYRKDQGK